MEKIILLIITAALRAISPELRNVLAGVVTSLKKSAASTDNPWDDLLVEVLGAVLGIKD